MRQHGPHLRVLSADVLHETVRDDVASPELATAHKHLWEHENLQVGIWEAGPSIDDDVESEEVFLVLGGSGTVTFEDGTRQQRGHAECVQKWPIACRAPLP